MRVSLPERMWLDHDYVGDTVTRMMQRDQEFEFSERNFRFIRDLVNQKSGIVLSDVKRSMVYSRLSRRLRRLELTSFDDYCELLQQGDERELIELINAITTNLTAFFREPHHFEYLGKTLLPRLFQRQNNRRIRIWSAGCSTGEEPYSIAMVVKESLPTYGEWDIRILATDLDSNVVAKATSGIYDQERIEGMDPVRVKKWFRRGSGDRANQVRVVPELQDLIVFKKLNLMEQWPVKGPFDVIFCRNVVIYFDKPTQKVLFERYADLLDADGHLFIGHSENLYNVTKRFKPLGKTIYQRAD